MGIPPRLLHGAARVVGRWRAALWAKGARCATTTSHKTPHNQLETEGPGSAEPIHEVSAHVAHEPVHRLDASNAADPERVRARVDRLGGSTLANRVRRKLLCLVVRHPDSHQRVPKVKHVVVVLHGAIKVHPSRRVDVGHVEATLLALVSRKERSPATQPGTRIGLKLPKSKKKSVGSKKSEGEKMSIGASSCPRTDSRMPSA